MRVTQSTVRLAKYFGKFGSPEALPCVYCAELAGILEGLILYDKLQAART